MSTDTAVSLLSKTAETVRKRDNENLNNGGRFNLLDVSGISGDEVKMCKILAEIISPEGSHCMGDFFLRSFVGFVLGIEADGEEISRAKVYTEYPTYEGRRIDIAIQTPKRFIPIEVKIYAEDREAQCSDYFKYGESLQKPYPSKVYYLTLDGRLPQSRGCAALTPVKEGGRITGYEEIIPLSFKDDIIGWLNACLAEKKLSDMSAVSASILQFKRALEGLTGNTDAEIKREIKDIISESGETIRTACHIAEAVTEAKIAMLKKLFEGLEKRISHELPWLEQLNNAYDYKSNNYSMINNYYRTKGSTHPGLIYKYTSIDEKRDIWFAVEVDYKLFCGFGVAYNNEITDKRTSAEELKRYIKLPHYDEDAWWFYWEYLPVHDNKGTYAPDFKSNNDAFFELFDDECFEEFTRKCTERIKRITE